MNYKVENFADIEILRYKVEGFEELSLNQKKLIYHLSEAALCGRDILFDQNYKYNLEIRKLLEKIYLEYSGNKECDEFKNFDTYLKRIWFSNGIHHHYSTKKFMPEFSEEYFKSLVKNIGYSKNIEHLINAMFNPSTDDKRVNLEHNVDIIETSANNYYSNISQKEVEDYYNGIIDSDDKYPISYGLNSRLVKDEMGGIKELVYKADGLFGAAIKQIVSHLNAAKEYAENEKQKQVIESLIEFYNIGDLKTFDNYSILWIKDTESQIDFVNGFIETYGDPLGMKASWESIVNLKNIEATKRTQIISDNAQWFEDNSPVNPQYKKKEVKGVTAKVITAAIIAGDCYPATPIGINLPNANWIREVHGSKSVTIENIMKAYKQASKGNGFADEFYLNKTEIDALNEYGFITDVLHTDLHECLGHGSGQMLDGVSQDELKTYGATIEEARADLFGLYYMADNKLVELGLLPNNEAYKTAYHNYLLNGLMTQTVRIPLGENLEESHMRNRQLIAAWVLKKSEADKACELIKVDNKTYVRINDFDKLRSRFGELLAYVQEIKSTGNYQGAKDLVEGYGVKINQQLHSEILDRYNTLNISPYRGFVNPVYSAILNNDNEIIDVQVSYNEGYSEQMLRYSKAYSYL